MARFEEYKDIFVFVEQENGNIAEVSYELISEARKLVASIPEFGYKVVGVLLGENVKEKAQEVISHGADKVIVVDDALLKDYSTQFYADALTQVVLAHKPDSMLTGATPLGRDLAPRVAARLNVGLTADATKIEVDLEYAKENGESLLDVTRPTFGGNLFGTIVCKDTRPQMATIRPKVFELAPTDPTRTGEVEEFTPTWRTTDPQVFVEKVIEKVKADVADELGGVVCCTRAVVEDGFLDKDRQVGQTGKTVRPSLYIACGISGQIQHIAGMQDAGIIISINNDENAPINTIADYVINGTVEEVIPKMIKYYKKNSK